METARTRDFPRSGASWGYEPHNGPALWATLDPAFSACAMGEEQSPIDLSAGRIADPIAIDFEYQRTRIAVENNGHTIQVNPDPGSAIVLTGARFDLLQFHFHHASEHTVDGIQLPLEMHLVHRNDGGSLAVVGVLFEAGQANDALAPVWAHLPTEPAAAHVVPGELDPASLLPATRTTWRYRGSLTTPPCTEGVHWIVLTEPLRCRRSRSPRSAPSIRTTFGPCSRSAIVSWTVDDDRGGSRTLG